MRFSAFVVLGLIAFCMGIFGISMTNAGPEVPEVVKTAFHKKFPDAKEVKWEMESPGEYEAEFELNGSEVSASFKEDGTWVGTETAIEESNLPQAVKDKIAQMFPDSEIEEVEFCEKPNEEQFYAIEMENEQEDAEFEVMFTADGKFLGKEMEEGDDQEDENR